MGLDRVGSAWKKTSKDGAGFLSCSISKTIHEGQPVLIFTNKEKKEGGKDSFEVSGKNYPDYHMFVADDTR